MTYRYPLDPVALTASLVAIDSRNPSLVPDGPGELACATHLAAVLNAWGFAVSLQEIAPGRANVIARIGPTGRTPLVLNGHLDVVGVDSMSHAPFAPEVRDGHMFGRGSTDMKGGIAAMCVAAARAAARGSLASEIVITAVCDEEYESIGTRALLAQGLRATGAIITEPTRLAIAPAHKGFAWIEVVLHGHAAHGSRYDVGVDANRHAGLLLAALDRYEHDVLTTRVHPLLGRASLHASSIVGGTGWSTYAERCTLHIERRTLPGESAEQALADVRARCDELAASRPGFQADVSLVCAQPPLDLALDAPLIASMRAACIAGGVEPTIAGLSCWTDAALFAEAGIPALCFGPGDIARAHSATEWVEIADLERAADILEAVCAGWGR
ncbi:ArgE/DapE family deacylase [Gemmatimonas sp.]|uniref:ArgE/DapE family deacylase n=1 Tax=Gemmatimonas sp. TaxID=1962908 RepID=UPI00286EB08A|nr:ArgE/DapE family deacylase [Gemmatimonas sp.]